MKMDLVIGGLKKGARAKPVKWSGYLAMTREQLFTCCLWNSVGRVQCLDRLSWKSRVLGERFDVMAE